MAPSLPALEFDYTLAELYALDNPEGPKHALVYAIPSANVQMTPNIPLSKKFAYQAPRAISLSGDVMARTCLAVGPQSHALVAGKMPLVLFDVETSDGDDPELKRHRADAYRVYNAVSADQRPELSFVTDPSEISLSPGTKVGVVNPMDCLLHLDHIIDPEVHYELLSKRGLAISELPQAKSEIVDTILTPNQVFDEDLLEAEVVRMMKPVMDAVPPFVVKMPSALAGQGVFAIRSEEDKVQAITMLTPELKRMIQQTTEENKHMYPSNLVVQEMLPGSAVALSLFITKAGRPIFISACEQVFDAHFHWGGCFNDYRKHDELREFYAETSEKIAKYLHGKGYYGPTGADVMIDVDGIHRIIDMNVRVPGSYTLGLLKTHFTKRGLMQSSLVYPLALKGTREIFEATFSKELEEGKIVIAGWCHGVAMGPKGKANYSLCSIACGGENLTQLRELIDRVSVNKIHK